MTTDQQTKQLSFSQAEYGSKKKLTRRDIFLAKMESVARWGRLIAVIEPYYPKSGRRGRPPIGLGRMPRMYFVQQWYGLADEAVEDALYDSQALRGFCGVNLAKEPVPDATTLMGFRHLLEANKLPQAILKEVNTLLEERGLLMNQGTLIDAIRPWCRFRQKSANGLSGIKPDRSKTRDTFSIGYCQPTTNHTV